MVITSLGYSWILVIKTPTVHTGPVPWTAQAANTMTEPSSRNTQVEKLSHVGDMPNLVAGTDGTVEAEFIIQHGTLEKDRPNSVLGRSLIIHAGEDDEVTDPAGNFGDRVAGGNIPESVAR